jgi:hypothetical protein
MNHRNKHTHTLLLKKLLYTKRKKMNKDICNIVKTLPSIPSNPKLKEIFLHHACIELEEN